MNVYIFLFYSFRDNLTSLSINVFPESNFVGFVFAPQNQFLIHIFSILALRDCNQKPKALCMLLYQFSR